MSDDAKNPFQVPSPYPHGRSITIRLDERANRTLYVLCQLTGADEATVVGHSLYAVQRGVVSLWDGLGFLPRAAKVLFFLICGTMLGLGVLIGATRYAGLTSAVTVKVSTLLVLALLTGMSINMVRHRSKRRWLQPVIETTTRQEACGDVPAVATDQR